MKAGKMAGWALAGALLMGLQSCFEPPEFPVVPRIEFDNIIFRDAPNPADADSLILTIRFTDGDGDLGINANENQPPFNERTYLRFPNGRFLNYADKRTNPNYDTLPAFVKPFNCTNWQVIFQDNNPVDTVYFQLNPFYNNIFVEFWVRQGSTFVKYDWNDVFTYPLCEVNGFDGRFPILAKDISRPGALEGRIRYSMRSPAFNFVFSTQTLRLRVHIADRARNRSNVIETPEFTLSSIRR